MPTDPPLYITVKVQVTCGWLYYNALSGSKSIYGITENMLYNLLPVLAALNVFLLYITRNLTLFPVPGHLYVEMGIALLFFFFSITRLATTRKYFDPHSTI